MTGPLRVLIVDDEPPARRKIARMLRNDPRFEVVGEAGDGLQALAEIEARSPNVVILDIQMPGLDGFELLAKRGNRPHFAVVFSTAYDAHALRAFDAHAVDYLLKPYDPERFESAMSKVWAHCLGVMSNEHQRAARVESPAASEPRPESRLRVRTATGSWVAIELADIVRLTAANKSTRIGLGGSDLLVRSPLSELAARLDARFVQVHRSVYINVDAVCRVDPWTHGDAIVVLQDDSTLVLTRTYRAGFLARFSLGKDKPR